MSKAFDPRDHYWLRENGLLFSSARIADVAQFDEDYAAWVGRGGVATAYPRDAEGNEDAAELQAVLDAYGLHATLAHYAGAVRYAAQIGGVSVAVGGGTYRFFTDSNGRASLSETRQLGQDFEAAGGSDAAGTFRTPWKSMDGYTEAPLSLADLATVGRAVGAHILACFGKEAEVDDGLAAHTITTKADVDAAFAALTTTESAAAPVAQAA